MICLAPALLPSPFRDEYAQAVFMLQCVVKAAPFAADPAGSEVYSVRRRLEGQRSPSMPKALVRCADCNCSAAKCMAAETARDCPGCSQVAAVSAECCCWQAAHGVA